MVLKCAPLSESEIEKLDVPQLNEELEKAGREPVTTENIGLVVDVYDDDDEDEIEKENEEVRDFVRCHPMLLPDDEEGETFWKKVIHRLKGDLGINEMMIYALVRFDIIKRIYENLTDKRVIVKCGKELNRDGKWDGLHGNKPNPFSFSDG